MNNLEIDYKKAAQQLRSGEALFGKDGALVPYARTYSKRSLRR